MQTQLDTFDNLRGKIGDASFSICDESWDEGYRHPNHPDIIRIIDCEDEVTIDVSAFDKDSTRETAEALLKLLNGNFKEVCKPN